VSLCRKKTSCHAFCTGVGIAAILMSLSDDAYMGGEEQMPRRDEEFQHVKD